MSVLAQQLEDRLGVAPLPGLPDIAWLVRHAMEFGRDGATLYERLKGGPHHGALCELYEVVHKFVHAFKGTQVRLTDICWAPARQVITRRPAPDLRRRGHPGTHSKAQAR